MTTNSTFHRKILKSLFCLLWQIAIFSKFIIFFHFIFLKLFFPFSSSREKLMTFLFLQSLENIKENAVLKVESNLSAHFNWLTNWWRMRSSHRFMCCWPWKKNTLWRQDHFPCFSFHDYSIQIAFAADKIASWLEKYTCVVLMSDGVRCSTHHNTSVFGNEYEVSGSDD